MEHAQHVAAYLQIAQIAQIHDALVANMDMYYTELAVKHAGRCFQIVVVVHYQPVMVAHTDTL